MNHRLIKWAFGANTRKRTWKKLATLLGNNVSEYTAIKMLQDRYQSRKHPLAHLFGSVLMARNAALPLNEAFAPFIPTEEVMLIHSGLRGNTLPKTLMDCVKLIETKEKIQKSVIMATVYPIFLLLMITALILLIAFYLVPQLSLISAPETWTGAAEVLYRVSNFIASPFGIVFSAGLVALICMVFFTLSSWTGSLRVKADLYPPWSIYRLIVGSVFMFTVATLLRANLSLDEILREMSLTVSKRPWLKERITRMQHEYKRNANIGELLTNLKMNFPDPKLCDDLAVYAAMPNFDNTLYELADEWLKDGIEKVENQTKLINTCLMVLVFSIFIWIILGVSSLIEQLHNTMGAF